MPQIVESIPHFQLPRPGLPLIWVVSFRQTSHTGELKFRTARQFAKLTDDPYDE